MESFSSGPFGKAPAPQRWFIDDALLGCRNHASPDQYSYQCISLFNDVDRFLFIIWCISHHITSVYRKFPKGQRSWPFSTRQISLAQKSWRWPTLMRPSLNRDVTLDVTLKDPNLSSYHSDLKDLKWLQCTEVKPQTSIGHFLNLLVFPAVSAMCQSRLAFYLLLGADGKCWKYALPSNGGTQPRLFPLRRQPSTKLNHSKSPHFWTCQKKVYDMYRYVYAYTCIIIYIILYIYTISACDEVHQCFLTISAHRVELQTCRWGYHGAAFRACLCSAPSPRVAIHCLWCADAWKNMEKHHMSYNNHVV